MLNLLINARRQLFICFDTLKELGQEVLDLALETSLHMATVTAYGQMMSIIGALQLDTFFSSITALFPGPDANSPRFPPQHVRPNTLPNMKSHSKQFGCEVFLGKLES